MDDYLQVTDITLNCIDLTTLRHKGVQAVSETLGLLLRYAFYGSIQFDHVFFFRYPMVSYCQESPKLCVGTKTGVLALYDLKSPKYQVRFASDISMPFLFISFSHFKLIQRMKWSHVSNFHRMENILLHILLMKGYYIFGR